MDFLKNINYSRRNKCHIFLFGLFLLMNSLKAFASDDRLYSSLNQKSYNFEVIYFQNSIPYSEYDGFYGQFKSFFGLNNDFSETSYYPDLSIISDSDNVREIYKSKLNDMIVDESIYKLKK